MKALLALLLGGCLATVSAGPINPDCWSQIAPVRYCESDYVWVSGYWDYNRWSGQRRRVSGHYQLRPGYHDHRR